MSRDLASWISEVTAGFQSVVEMGCGFAENLDSVNPCVTQRIGIDIHKPYLDRARRGHQLFLADMRDLTKLPERSHPSVALVIDVLEHLEQVDGRAWLEAMKDEFERIAVCCPYGFHVQNEDTYGLGGDAYQTHRSAWFPDDLKAAGFKVHVDPGYHDKQTHKGSIDAIFAVWDR